MATTVDTREKKPAPSTSPAVIGLLAGLFAALGGVVLAFGGPLAGLAVVMVGAAAFIVLRNMEIGLWGVIAIVCLLPFATLPVDIGLTPTFLDVALAAVVGIWVLRFATGQQRTLVTTPLTIPLIVFMLVAVFAFIFGLSNGPLTPTLVRRFAELQLSLGFVLVVIDYCRDWERLERLVKVLILAGAAAGLLGIVLWLIPEETANTALNTLQRVGYPGGWVIRYIEENPELAERAIGTSVDPNSFGGLLLLIGALIAPQLATRKPLLPKVVTVGALLLVSAALVLTFSRGAMVGLVAGIFFVAVARYRRLIPAMVAAGLLFLALPFTQGYVSRFVAGIQGQDLATQMRFGEYTDALTLIARYPLFGVGFAGSPDIDVYLGVANVYLTIGQQMGFLGLLAFLVVIGALFVYAVTNRRYFRTDRAHDALWLGLHAAVVGGLVSGIFDHYLFNMEFHHAVTVFWFILGMAAAATRLGSVSSKN